MKFYVCKHCGNIVKYVHNAGVPVVCCGEKMEELVPNTADAAGEKHVPVVSQEGNTVTVKVGEVEHPMTEEHYIPFIILETKKGAQKAELSPGEAPVATFVLSEGDEVVAAYEYCTLHGMWKDK